MTEKEVLDLQEERGNQVFYLILIGSFLNAYGNGAFALSRATGYRVIRKQRKQLGEVLTAGFPVSSLGGVREKLLAAGGELDEVDEKTWIFRGIDGTPDLTMVTEGAKVAKVSGMKAPDTSAPSSDWLADEVRRFNLSMSTPLDAMLFIGTLQERLKQEDIAEKVQGADCPQGKAPGIACESPSGQGSAE
ncbi:MAG: hypothetical protein J5913_00220 [Prevotella sp.]|nr:hypothetical protein [Prevotella sp.]